MSYEIFAKFSTGTQTAVASSAHGAWSVGNDFFEQHAHDVKIMAPGRPLPYSLDHLQQAIMRGDLA